MRLGKLGKSLMAASLAGVLAGGTASAASAAPSCWSAEMERAARLRQLDVMLMVGSLRCRSTAQDYRAAYDRFLLRHRPVLGRANLRMLSEMRLKLGFAGAAESLDKASVRMANRYGQEGGYGCADLAEVTAALARSGPEALTDAADMLVGDDVTMATCPVQVATADPLPSRR